MNAVELAGLTCLMQLSSGRPEIGVALIDGPVAMDHSDLWSTSVQRLDRIIPAACRQPASVACRHGTFVAGILAARRNSRVRAFAPAAHCLFVRYLQRILREPERCPAPCPVS